MTRADALAIQLEAAQEALRGALAEIVRLTNQSRVYEDAVAEWRPRIERLDDAEAKVTALLASLHGIKSEVSSTDPWLVERINTLLKDYDNA